MSLVDDIKELAGRANKYSSGGLDESNTESVLIDPFIQALGYNTKDPSEVIKQLPAAYAGKSKKVDFAILRDKVPIVLFECKRVGTLSREKAVLSSATQLSQYFNNTPSAKFGILTDGVRYHFFSDLDHDNVMDKEPFHVLNLREVDRASLIMLDQFTRPKFSANGIRTGIRQARRVKEVLRPGA